jgi:hypothetical protein
MSEQRLIELDNFSGEPDSEVKQSPEQAEPALPETAAPPKKAPKTPAPRKRTPRANAPRKKKRSKKAKNTVLLRHKLLSISLEVLGLSAALLVAVMILLGYAADRFAGTGFFSNLLPFAAGVLGFILAAALALVGWWKLRAWLNGKTSWLTPALSLSLALAIGWFSTRDGVAQGFGYFRTLVGATEEAERATIAHQVYAAYRRTGPALLQQMIDRAQAFAPAIQEASKTFGIDRELLYGLAATESSFLPRDSKDGGHGLFQITQVPQAATALAQESLGVTGLDLGDPRHNAFIAAATLHYYLSEMHGDLFLGLLAYNIGPKNGGLRFIMQQYGAKDFVTIQPYLQTLPRDYPIRVLSYALAFRLWQQVGKLPAYEEGNNAARIQSVGIPGFERGV